jgi:hypothetical protein
MRIRAKGLHWTPVTLAERDEENVLVCLAWRSAAHRRIRLAAIHRELQHCHCTKVIAPEGKLLSLLQAYQQSQDFLSKRPRTRTDYIKQIAKIEQKFGNAPIKALADPRTRGIFLE